MKEMGGKAMKGVDIQSMGGNVSTKNKSGEQDH